MRSRKRNSSNFFYDYQDSSTSPTKKSHISSSKDGPAMGNYDPKYPESFTAFADGLKSDVMDLIGTSAGLLNRSISFIFPFMGYETVETSMNDSLHDIEVINSKTQKNKQQHDAKMKQSQEAIKMRCQSLWTKDANGTNSTSSESSNSQSQVQKGGKVLLDKLAKNSSIQSYPCGDGDDHLVILGNVRMIVAKKNYDSINSASILWSQPFREIATCAINCSLR